ncbi:unnamed protein product [Microthlaspi erraticum]|uniref:Retrotransposon gag domain-containing protein n=1 Tax=Microthlaspi erraticum TaxID=1685480 RepID=A0A6D2KUU7_9BRAS|nr:unnamed protein product [Microthlaspi erraticum]
MATQEEVSAASKMIEDHHLWMEMSRSELNILQNAFQNVEESALVSKEKETDFLWRRVNTATALLTFLKSKATTVSASDFSQLSLGTSQQLEPSCFPGSGLFESIACGDGVDEVDGTYVTEMLNHVETVTGVMESLARRAVIAESEAAIEKEKVALSQEEIERKVGEMEKMAIKLEDMEKYALGTTSILGEFRQWPFLSRQSRSRRHRDDPDRLVENLGGYKIRIPPFHGNNNPDEYMDWEKKCEFNFNLHNISNINRVKLAVSEFNDYALRWWEQVVTAREIGGALEVSTWEEMKRIMRQRFIPSYYQRELHSKLRRLTQGSKTVEEYFQEMEGMIMRANVIEDREATMSRFLGGLNREIQDVWRCKTADVSKRLQTGFTPKSEPRGASYSQDKDKSNQYNSALELASLSASSVKALDTMP